MLLFSSSIYSCVGRLGLVVIIISGFGILVDGGLRRWWCFCVCFW